MHRNMGKRIKLYIIILTMILSCLGGIISWATSNTGKLTPDASASDRIVMDISYGYDDTAKVGRYLPIHITYSTADDYAFAGKVALTAQESDGELYEYDYALTLEAGKRVRQEYYIPLGIYTDRISVSLIDNNDTVTIENTIKLNTDGNVAVLNMGILSDNPQNLDYLENTNINYGRLRTNTIQLNSEIFPYDAIGLDLFDVILISDYRIRNLEEKQSRALMDWVSEGGVLIMGTGYRVADTLGRYAPELLDDMYSDPEDTELTMSSSPQDVDSGSNTITVPYTEFTLHGGNAVITSASKTLVSTVNKTNGLIAVAGFDFTDIKEYVDTHNSFVDSMLVRIMGNSRISELTNQMNSTSETGYLAVQNLINVGDVTKLPSVNLYYMAILAYILLIGPALFVFLKQRNLSGYYVLGVTGLSVMFMGVIYLMGSQTRFTDTFYHYATIRDADDESIKNTTYLNLMNPYNSDYSVRINPLYSVRPITEIDDSSVYRPAPDLTVGGDIKIDYNENQTTVSVDKVGAFNPRFFRLEGTGTNYDGEGFEGDVALFENHISGEITNNYDFDVTGAAIVAYGKIVLIGDMKAGETKSITGLTVYNTPLIKSYNTCSIITGLDRNGDLTAADGTYLRDIERTNLLSFYIDNYMVGYTADARVVAFSKATMVDTELVQGLRLESGGTTLLTSPISLDSRDGDEIYRSVLVKNPQVMSGEYDVYSNMMYGIDPAVLNYTLGSDVDIERICFENISEEIVYYDSSEDISIFDGEIALYNYDTGNYDAIKADGQPIDVAVISNYLSPSNNMTVRYTSNTIPVGGDGIVLPMLTIVGRN